MKYGPNEQRLIDTVNQRADHLTNLLRDPQKLETKDLRRFDYDTEIIVKKNSKDIGIRKRNGLLEELANLEKKIKIAQKEALERYEREVRPTPEQEEVLEDRLLDENTNPHQVPLVVQRGTTTAQKVAPEKKRPSLVQKALSGIKKLLLFRSKTAESAGPMKTSSARRTISNLKKS